MNAPPSLLVNRIRNAIHWVAIRPVGTFPVSKTQSPATSVPSASPGTKSNRDAIGARIRVKAGARILIDEVRSGSSYISNNDMRVHFGLGSATKIDWVEIRWPGGLVEKFENVAVDAFHTLKEGTGTSATNSTKN
jgi:hypothetical protein